MEHKKTILLIEDDSGSRKLISVVLGRAGYEIIAAADGTEAMEKTHAAQPVDLIIVDLELPGLSGGKIIRQIKDDPSTSHIPMIVTTSCDRESPLVQEAVQAGAAKILYKPTSMNILMTEVGRYLA